MKNIKTFKQFESFNEFDELYQRIEYSKFREEFEPRIIDITDTEFSNIENLLRGSAKYFSPWTVKKSERFFQSFQNAKISVCAKMRIDKLSNKDIEIFKIDDEWFVVKYTIENKLSKSIYKYYLCDEIDGLKRFIDNI